MEHGKFYTAEALRGLNAAYDAEYGITSLETDKVNGIIRCMDDTRKLSLVRRRETCSNIFRKTVTTSRRRISKRQEKGGVRSAFLPAHRSAIWKADGYITTPVAVPGRRFPFPA